jgi:conjugal transfer/entry exclusion protein
MEQIKLSQEELNTLNQLQETQNNIINSLGQLEYNIQLLELKKEKLTEEIENLKKVEVEIGEDLSKKYGNGSIDLTSGTFTPSESDLETS